MLINKEFFKMQTIKKMFLLLNMIKKTFLLNYYHFFFAYFRLFCVKKYKIHYKEKEKCYEI